MTRDKPNCPICNGNDDVKTLGGGTHQKYRYQCEKCTTSWQQIPPHRANDFEESDTKEILICKSKQKRTNNYRCGKCGQIKKGHKCSSKSASQSSDTENNIVKKLIQNPFHPPVLALQEGQTVPVPFSNFDELDVSDMPALSAYKNI